MQLKKKESTTKYIKTTLSIATCSLLSIKPQIVEAVEIDRSWETNAAVLYYTESERVNVVEPVLFLKKEISDNEFLKAKLVFDSISGSSPIGASATTRAQTITTSSGSSSTTVKENEIPMVEFRDNRRAVEIEWDMPIGRLSRAMIGLGTSNEFDYVSYGASTTFSKELESRMTTFNFGIAANKDTITAEGGIPIGLAMMDQAGSKLATENNEKNTHDILLGITKVLSSHTRMQLNYTYRQMDGYLTEFHKILSVVDATTGETLAYRNEKRPDTRENHVFFWKIANHMSTDSVQLSYRYFLDDWDIRSHTIDSKYHYVITPKHYLEPHIRWYSQSAAGFYTHSIVNGILPEFASADHRLAELTTTTMGIKYAYKMDKKNEISFRGEYMEQTGKQPTDTIGVQKNQKLFPDMVAYIFQIAISTKF